MLVVDNIIYYFSLPGVVPVADVGDRFHLRRYLIASPINSAFLFLIRRTLFLLLFAVLRNCLHSVSFLSVIH